MDFFTLKALHLIFIVTWFAGLFYIVRLFIYQTEAAINPQLLENERKILTLYFKLMAKRLWYGITTPSLFLTLATGLALLGKNWGYYSEQSWIYLKLGLVLGLIGYHFYCGWIFKQLQSDKIPYSPNFLRIFNEIASIFLVSIVFVAVYKNMLSLWKGLAGLGIFTALLLLGIYIYKRRRS